MTTHDINNTCKHNFIDLEHLSRFRNQILIVMIFRHSSFDVNFLTIFKNDPMMMIYKMWVKTFDILIIDRIANMKSADGATQLADECQVNGRKRRPTTD